MSAKTAVVVGAGIVGAAVARSLAEDGCAVTVVDPAAPGSGTSAAGMGHVVVMDDSPAQLALTVHSRRLWDSLAPDLPQAVERDPCGTLWVAADAAEMEAVAAKQAVLEGAGVRSAVRDAAWLRAEEPHLARDLVGALHVQDDSVVYPPVATAWFLDHPRITRVRSRVRSLGGGRVALEDGAFGLEADVLVLAAGERSLDLLEQPVPGARIRPRKGHLVITDRYPGYCRHQIVELGYLASAHGTDATSVAFNVQPRRTGQILLGSSRQFDVPEDDDRVEPDVLTRMIARARRYLPDIDGLSVVRAWTGFRGATVDKLPFIGPHPADPSLFLATGHEGLGITTATGTAALIADLVAERSPMFDPTPYRPDRFAEDVA